MQKNVSELTREEAQEELAFLAKKIGELDIAYHRDDAPLLTDAEYDALKHRNNDIEALFPDLIREDSPSFRVGSKISDDFKKVTHSIPMLSLGDIFTDEAVYSFVDKIKRFLGMNENDPLEFFVTKN